VKEGVAWMTLLYGFRRLSGVPEGDSTRDVVLRDDVVVDMSFRVIDETKSEDVVHVGIWICAAAVFLVNCSR
jgi:hypothetical protein